MAANKKPRRAYDPSRRIRLSIGLTQATGESHPLAERYLVDLSLGIHVAFDTTLRGGDEAAWSTLSQAANVSLILAENGFGPEFIPDIKRAQDGLMRAAARAGQTQRWGFDGDGIADLRTLIELHDQQMEIAPRAEVRKVIREMHRRLEAGDILEIIK